MNILYVESNGDVSVEIYLWLFNDYKNIRTLLFEGNQRTIPDFKEFKIWLIYQDQNTLKIASEYFLKNYMHGKIPFFYSERLLFSAKAKLAAGRLCFDFNTNCGIKKEELERGVCFMEDRFVKIGLRS